jgi:phosphoribosylformimino-5-aminoimidazole carboxamide ribotide isomerase
MRIIPAIDIIGGKCVRLSQGDYNQQTTYDYSPLEMAKQYEENGIKYLHLVDLDGAKSKTIVNKKVLEEICSKTNLVVDFGGGIKSEQDLKDAFSCGAAKITAGSIAATDKEEVFKWISSYGSDRIVLGADVQDKHVMINGWKTRTDYSINALLSIYIEKGIQEVISTDISVDGMMTGPAIDLYKEIMSSFSTVKLIASGGVGACSDLDELLKIGVDGVIIGKAIYENKISLKELQKYVN